VQAGNSSAEVSVDATGLQPNTNYKVTLLASSLGGPVSAGSVAFTTLAEPPTIESEFVTNVAATSATFQAKIDAGGAETGADLVQEQVKLALVAAPSPDGYLHVLIAATGVFPVSAQLVIMGLLADGACLLRTCAATRHGLPSGRDRAAGELPEGRLPVCD
jgi:hypothetical protein